MYEVQIINRGPEGIRGHKQFRLTEDGGNELQKRIESGERSLDQLLLGLQQLAPDAAEQQPATGKRKKAAPADV